MQMNEEEINQFLLAFEDFMKHAEIAQFNHESWASAQEYASYFYEQKAAELEITVDYLMAEFMVD